MDSKNTELKKSNNKGTNPVNFQKAVKNTHRFETFAANLSRYIKRGQDWKRTLIFDFPPIFISVLFAQFLARFLRKLCIPLLLYYLNMRSLRKQMKLISNLVQTLLQFRLNPSNGLIEHLGEMRKKIRQMILTQTYEEGIAEMLVSKQSFQIRNKIAKFENQLQNSNSLQLTIQIRISAIEKCSCQKYNQQLWQFSIQVAKSKSSTLLNEASKSTVELIEHTLRYLMCYSLLPLNKQHRNKHMIDHKVTISCEEIPVQLTQFGNMSTQQLIISKTSEGSICRVETNYFFNQRKVQQSLKQIIISRSLQTSENSKKNSSDTTDSFKRVSLFQHYDEELDITVLSGSDSSFENGEEIQMDLENFQDKEDDDQDQFQILIEETRNDDQLLLHNNFSLFKQLSAYEFTYF